VNEFVEIIYIWHLFAGFKLDCLQFRGWSQWYKVSHLCFDLNPCCWGQEFCGYQRNHICLTLKGVPPGLMECMRLILVCNSWLCLWLFLECWCDCGMCLVFVNNSSVKWYLEYDCENRCLWSLLSKRGKTRQLFFPVHAMFP